MDRTEDVRWKRVAGLMLWLILFPPIGLWKLWADPVLSASSKWRILIYLFILPLLGYAAVTLSQTTKALQNILP